MGLAQVVIVADDFTNLKPDVMATHAKIEPLLTQCRRWWLQRHQLQEPGHENGW